MSIKLNTVIVSFLGAGLYGSAYSQVAEPKKPITFSKAEATQHKVLINGKEPSSFFNKKLLPKTRITNSRAQNYVLYSFIQCDAGWDQKCENHYDFKAPPGWQACDLIFSSSAQHGHQSTWSKAAGDWYTNDPESPDRYRTIAFGLASWGNRDPIFNPTGAVIRFDNIGIKILPANANNFERYAEGCMMSPHD
jgi:hypothetical protein